MKKDYVVTPGMVLRVRRKPYYRALMFDANGTHIRRLDDGELVTVLRYVERGRAQSHIAVIASDCSVGFLWWEREAFEASEYSLTP